MPFIEEILHYKSLSIVGLEKNTGKTETFNYILRRLQETEFSVGITSIGVDGEQIDSVSHTPKPDIEVYAGMHFVTSERHYGCKQFISSVEHIYPYTSGLGRMVIGRAITSGKLLLSGPSDTARLQQVIFDLGSRGVDIVMVDGALSRLSLASPSVTEALVLATGASVSNSMPELINKTHYQCQLINLPVTTTLSKQQLSKIGKGVWAIDANGELVDLNIGSLLLLDNKAKDQLRQYSTFYISGAITDRGLNFFVQQKSKNPITLIVSDFTKLFISQPLYTTFIKKGGQFNVLYRSNLLAVTANPTAPNGFCFHSDLLINNLQQRLMIPVYDIRKIY